MSGTSEGGKKAAETVKQEHGQDFHQKIGEKGGQSNQSQSAAANKSTGNLKKDQSTRQNNSQNKK